MKHIKLFNESWNLVEGSEDYIKRKNQWVTLSNDMKYELDDEIFGLIDTAYSAIGGHLKFPTVDSVHNIQVAQMIDIDDDPYADIIIFGKNTMYGVKSSGVGHDGTKKSKKFYLNNIIQRMSDANNPQYVEVSHKIADILLSSGVHVIDSEGDIRKILKGKEIDFIGSIKGKMGNGWYSRKIGGKKQTKILVGYGKNIN